MRSLCLALFTIPALLLVSNLGYSGDKKISFEVFAKGYFVKNNAKLPGNPAYVVIQDKKAYDEIFGFGAVMGAKPKLVNEKLFEDHLVVTLIKSGSTLWKYEVEQITRDKNQLVVKYTAGGKESPNAKFNSPMILSVPRGDYSEIVFIENGKEVGKQAVKK